MSTAEEITSKICPGISEKKNEDTQEMPQSTASRGTERRRDQEQYNNKTNATYETTEAQKKTATAKPSMNGQQKNYWDGRKAGALKSVLLGETSTSILI